MRVLAVRKETEAKEGEPAQVVPKTTPSTIVKNTLITIATCIVFFGVIAVFAAISQANDRAKEKRELDDSLTAQNNEQRAAMKKEFEAKCPKATIYPYEHIEETPTISISIVSAAIVVQTKTTQATAQAPQSSTQVEKYKVTYRVKNKTGTKVNIGGGLYSYDLPVVRIDGSSSIGYEGMTKDINYLTGDTGIPITLEPYQSATQTQLIDPGKEIILGIGPDSYALGGDLPSKGCLMKGWKVR